MRETVLPLTIPSGFPQWRRWLSTQCNVYGKTNKQGQTLLKVTTERSNFKQSRMKFLCGSVEVYRTLWESGGKKRCTSFIHRKPTCIWRRSWVAQRVWATLLSPAESRLWRWGLITTHETSHRKKTSTFRDKKGDLKVKDVNQAGVPLLHRHAAHRTVFKLFTHDGACWRGHVVCGVLLRVGGRDDGHQVVSVGRVHLRTSRHDTMHQALFKWQTPINRFHLNQPHLFSSRARKKKKRLFF